MQITTQVALITGAAKRVGAIIAKTLHHAGWQVIIHYNQSKTDAENLCSQLNSQRQNSAIIIQADLKDASKLNDLIDQSYHHFGRLDALINNASLFYPTMIGKINDQDWQQLFDCNIKAPFFLSQAAIPYLKKNQGNIINIVDIHGIRPLKDYSIYCMSKASLISMTQSLAKSLAPAIRVNGIAPGLIMWPDHQPNLAIQQNIIDKVALKKCGHGDNIAKTVLFLLQNDYITGEIIAVDGGRLLNV